MQRVVLVLSIALAAAALLGAGAFLVGGHGGSPEDAQARRIMEECGLGALQSGNASLGAELGRNLRSLRSEGSVTSGRVAALMQKIASEGENGRTYQAYSECLARQTELELRRQGVQVSQEVRPEPASVTAPPVLVAPAAGKPPHQPDAIVRPSPAPVGMQTNAPCSQIINGSSNVNVNCTAGGMTR